MLGRWGSLPDRKCGRRLGAGANSRCHRGALHVSVLATEGIIADAQHVPDNAEAIAHGMNLGAVVVAPGNGDFSHFKVQAPGKKEDLSVKTPALHPLRRENRAGGLATESLESALGVFLRK